MKYLKFITLALAIGLVLPACKKDKNDDDGISTGDGCSASWKVDGTSYSENNMALCIYLDNTLNLSASTTGGSFQLQIDPITSTGSYEVDNTVIGAVTTVLLMDLNDGTKIGIKDGTINVTEISSSKAKGTFSGNFFDLIDITLTPSFSVTDGVFEANF